MIVEYSQLGVRLTEAANLVMKRLLVVAANMLVAVDHAPAVAQSMAVVSTIAETGYVAERSRFADEETAWLGTEVGWDLELVEDQVVVVDQFHNRKKHSDQRTESPQALKGHNRPQVALVLIL